MDRKMIMISLLVVFWISTLVPTLAEAIYKVNYKQVPAEPVLREGFVHVQARYLITEKQGAKNFAMRLFEISPGGHTSYHTHPWEHEIFVKKGHGILISEDERYVVGEGDVIFIAPGEKHQFRNESEQTLELICLIPLKPQP
jgi:quercetin dioxygenase-like cupin family protein